MHSVLARYIAFIWCVITGDRGTIYAHCMTMNRDQLAETWVEICIYSSEFIGCQLIHLYRPSTNPLTSAHRHEWCLQSRPVLANCLGCEVYNYSHHHCGYVSTICEVVSFKRTSRCSLNYLAHVHEHFATRVYTLVQPFWESWSYIYKLMGCVCNSYTPLSVSH